MRSVIRLLNQPALRMTGKSIQYQRLLAGVNEGNPRGVAAEAREAFQGQRARTPSVLIRCRALDMLGSPPPSSYSDPTLGFVSERGFRNLELKSHVGGGNSQSHGKSTCLLTVFYGSISERCERRTPLQEAFGGIRALRGGLSNRTKKDENLVLDEAGDLTWFTWNLEVF